MNIIKQTPEYTLKRDLDTNRYQLSVIKKEIPIDSYFPDVNDQAYLKTQTFYHMPICEYLRSESNLSGMDRLSCNIEDGLLVVDYTTDDSNAYLDILEAVRQYYEKNAVHITRMFGSYILLAREDHDDLKAIKASTIPIKYCPLMIQLLKEVGGKTSEKLIAAMDTEDKALQSQILEQLINEVVIKGGYFDTGRPLNSCEANVTFGASETISSAFKEGLVDAAVIVSNNLGTIITTNQSNTQGAVKRMTGLFYTSPSEEIMQTAHESGIIPVYPYTAHIDQIAGVRHAIKLGYRNIAVTLASSDNIRQAELHRISEETGATIYQFGLCSTGISEDAAQAMQKYADIIWSCASKQVKLYIEPVSIAQVGVKIPVHIMTKKGWKLVKPHLKQMNASIEYDHIKLNEGNDKPIFLNDGDSIKMITKNELQECSDCPHPCI